MTRKTRPRAPLASELGFGAVLTEVDLTPVLGDVDRGVEAGQGAPEQNDPSAIDEWPCEPVTATPQFPLCSLPLVAEHSPEAWGVSKNAYFGNRGAWCRVRRLRLKLGRYYAQLTSRLSCIRHRRAAREATFAVQSQRFLLPFKRMGKIITRFFNQLAQLLSMIIDTFTSVFNNLLITRLIYRIGMGWIVRRIRWPLSRKKPRCWFGCRAM